LLKQWNLQAATLWQEHTVQAAGYAMRIPFAKSMLSSAMGMAGIGFFLISWHEMPQVFLCPIMKLCLNCEVLRKPQATCCGSAVQSQRWAQPQAWQEI